MSDDDTAPFDLAALSAWAPELAKTFVSLSNDIALVIDADGVIRNVAQGGAESIAPGAQHWVGQPWIDTVSGETRTKIAHLLREVSSTGLARRREVNHLLAGDLNVPVAYTAIRLGLNGPVLAVGRDLRAIAAIQQRYVDSQQEMERGYWQMRQAEARYQLLFQVATDAVLVVDGETLQIVEANQAAATLFNAPADQLAGRPAAFGFQHHARAAVNELLTTARGSGHGGEIRARLQGDFSSASVVATPFRTVNDMRLLMRVRSSPDTQPAEALNQTLSRLVDSATDGIVVTDSSGRILVANRAFLALAELAAEADVKGQRLMRWLRLADQPLAELMARVRGAGIARQIESWVLSGASGPKQVEVSAALLTEGDQECIGFTIHPVFGAAAVGREVGDDTSDKADGSGDRASRVLQAGLVAIARRLGDDDLAALVRDAGALAERHFVELAMQRSAGRVDSAAALLGISTERLQRQIGSLAPPANDGAGRNGS